MCYTSVVPRLFPSSRLVAFTFIIACRSTFHSSSSLTFAILSFLRSLSPVPQFSTATGHYFSWDGEQLRSFRVSLAMEALLPSSLYSTSETSPFPSYACRLLFIHLSDANLQLGHVDARRLVLVHSARPVSFKCPTGDPLDDENPLQGVLQKASSNKNRSFITRTPYVFKPP